MADTVLVQLRLSPEDAEELRQAGLEGGRSLPGEVRYRMKLFADGCPGAEQRLPVLEDRLAERDREIVRLNGVIDGLTMALAHLKPGGG